MKGRATANFDYGVETHDGKLTITVIADVSDVTLAESYSDSANGTVALGKAIAQAAKVATPISSRERKVHDMTTQLISEGLSEARALTLAESFVK